MQDSLTDNEIAGVRALLEKTSGLGLRIIDERDSFKERVTRLEEFHQRDLKIIDELQKNCIRYSELLQLFRVELETSKKLNFELEMKLRKS